MLAIHRFQRGLTPIPRISPHPTHVFAQGPPFLRFPADPGRRDQVGHITGKKVGDPSEGSPTISEI